MDGSLEKTTKEWLDKLCRQGKAHLRALAEEAGEEEKAAKLCKELEKNRDERHGSLKVRPEFIWTTCITQIEEMTKAIMKMVSNIAGEGGAADLVKESHMDTVLQLRDDALSAQPGQTNLEGFTVKLQQTTTALATQLLKVISDKQSRQVEREQLSLARAQMQALTQAPAARAAVPSRAGPSKPQGSGKGPCDYQLYDPVTKTWKCTRDAVWKELGKKERCTFAHDPPRQGRQYVEPVQGNK